MVPHYQRLCFIALFVLVTACQQRQGVDLLLVNAEIYTVDESKPWAEALAIREGQIQVGKKADLVVLSENLFGLPPEKIGEVEVVATYFDGREVYTHER